MCYKIELILKRNVSKKGIVTLIFHNQLLTKATLRPQHVPSRYATKKRNSTVERECAFPYQKFAIRSPTVLTSRTSRETNVARMNARKTTADAHRDAWTRPSGITATAIKDTSW